IATAIGATLVLGVGLGLTMRLGATRLSTMDVGTTSAAVGAGARDRTMRGHIGALRLLGSTAAEAGALDLASGSAAESAGSRLDSANRSARGIATALDTDGTSTFTTRTFAT